MKFRIIKVFCFLLCMISFNSCYHSYADYVDDIEITYNDGKYDLTWSPVDEADKYIVYAQTEYKYSDKTDTYLKIVAETEETRCTIASSSLPYNCKCLRIVAVKDGHKTYLSEEIKVNK